MNLGQAEFKSLGSDKNILLHITKVLFKSKDPESLICSNSVSINRQNFETMTDTQLAEVFDDVYQFGCSFVDQENVHHNQCSIDFHLL